MENIIAFKQFLKDNNWPDKLYYLNSVDVLAFKYQLYLSPFVKHRNKNEIIGTDNGFGIIYAALFHFDNITFYKIIVPENMKMADSLFLTSGIKMAVPTRNVDVIKANYFQWLKCKIFGSNSQLFE